MTNFTRIFDAFSNRPEASAKPTHEIPQSTRNRVLIWCRELYSNSRSDFGSVGRGDYNSQFWEEIYRRLLIRTGRLRLYDATGEDFRVAIPYVLNCSGQEFLNFLEDIFSTDCFFHVSLGEDQLVDELNAVLRQDNLPYYVTRFVKEPVTETSGQHAGRTVVYTRAYPKVIMKESEVLHANAVAPALLLLQRPHFQSANNEYLAALEDYRKGDFGDCLTKCGSAFESVLKVICDRKGWSYKQTDTASTLINTVLPKTSLDKYFEQLLIIVTTLRNRLSSAHGGGTAIKQPPPHVAQYAINATASAILLLTQETGEY
jgi:hypothetical protein